LRNLHVYWSVTNARACTAMNNQQRRTNFTPSDDALIRRQTVTGIGLKQLATILRISREAIMRRTDELGVSLATSKDHDGAIRRRTFSCTDGFVHPLLKRLKQMHGDEKKQR